jgi:hypothetical protein
VKAKPPAFCVNARISILAVTSVKIKSITGKFVAKHRPAFTTKLYKVSVQKLSAETLQVVLTSSSYYFVTYLVFCWKFPRIKLLVRPAVVILQMYTQEGDWLLLIMAVRKLIPP